MITTEGLPLRQEDARVREVFFILPLRRTDAEYLCFTAKAERRKGARSIFLLQRQGDAEFFIYRRDFC